MRKQLELTESFFKLLESYRKIYQEYMRFTDEQMPDDETLIEVAIMADIDELNNFLNNRKRRGCV